MDLTPPSLLLNGRFLGRPATGVDRVARELARALRSLAQSEPDSVGGLLVATPRRHGADLPGFAVCGPSSGPGGHLWEQAVLPFVAPQAMLLSLCNSGPVLRRRQVVMIHDAQVITHPDSYTVAFRTAYRVLLPVLARRAAVVLTVSDHSRRALEQHGIVPRGKAVVVHNGVDHILRISEDVGVLSRLGLEAGRYLLAIGSMAPHKNLPLLLRAALARRHANRLPLVVAGGMNARVFAGQHLPQGEDIRFVGRVNDAELKALYGGARALAFPSRTEGFGLPPLEAMLCGCPVIATTAGAVAEVCGQAVLPVDPDDEAGWTRALEHVETDDALCAALADAGARQAAPFTWEQAARSVLRACRAAMP